MSGFYLNQPDPFFTDIEAAVSQQRGKPFNANPADWKLMRAWKDRGIPFHIIARVIEAAPESVNSLGYFSKAVEKAFAEWQPSQVGAVSEAVTFENCPTCGEAYCLSLHRADEIIFSTT